MPLDEALYRTPVSFLMLMCYQLAVMHDNTIFTLQDKEAADARAGA